MLGWRQPREVERTKAGHCRQQDRAFVCTSNPPGPVSRSRTPLCGAVPRMRPAARLSLLLCPCVVAFVVCSFLDAGKYLYIFGSTPPLLPRSTSQQPVITAVSRICTRRRKPHNRLREFDAGSDDSAISMQTPALTRSAFTHSPVQSSVPAAFTQHTQSCNGL